MRGKIIVITSKYVFYCTIINIKGVKIVFLYFITFMSFRYNEVKTTGKVALAISDTAFPFTYEQGLGHKEADLLFDIYTTYGCFHIPKHWAHK